MNSTPLIAGQRAPGEGICEKRNGLPGFHLKNAYLTLVLLGSGGLAELLLCDWHVQTKIKLLICILPLLTEFCFVFTSN